MKKRIITSYSLSFILPIVAFAVIAMKLSGKYRWHWATALYAAGWLCLTIAARKHRKSRILLQRQGMLAARSARGNRKYIITFLATLLLGYIAYVLFPMGVAPDPARIDKDIALLPVYMQGLDKAMDAIQAKKKLFQKDIRKLSPKDKQKVLELWSRFLAYSMELERLKHIHQCFYRIAYIKYPDLNSRSFLVAYSAFIANYQNSLKLTALIGTNEQMATLLNERRDELDIPANSYFSLKQAITHPGSLVKLNAGQANFQILNSTRSYDAMDEQFLVTRSDEAYREIVELIGKRPEIFAHNPREFFERESFKAWLPLQKGVAEGMSIVRTTKRENFITLDDIKTLMPELQPGDILLERRNWYLTNIGIPGFWPHVALYTGTLKEMDAFFEDDPLLKGKTVSDYVAEHHPDLFKALTSPTNIYPCRTMEALAPGVIPMPLEKSARADYLSVLRPKLDKTAKLRAIMRAFTFHKRPYDYNFDFATDNELVCSEVVYKAYRPAWRKPGLDFELKETAGRLLLPPNSIARKFATEHGTKDAQLEFVAFLDGSETKQKAERKEVEEFLTSWQRPKWDVAQE